MPKRRRPKPKFVPFTKTDRDRRKLLRRATRLLRQGEIVALDDDPLHIVARLARKRGIRSNIP